jgi:hypothetical protein
MDKSKILFSALAGLLLVAPAMAQTAAPCSPFQQCPNAPRVPFPVINPVQGLNALTNRLQAQRGQQPMAVVPWNYAPVATPPPNLPPELRPR